MPLSAPAPRRDIHRRVIDMKAYAREDGLYDVEARLVDTKPFPFTRLSRSDPQPAGEPMHDLWVRLTVDDGFVVRAVEAASDSTPYDVCKEAERTLSVLVGEKIARGWSAVVKERLRGAASCTHLMELMIPLATTALQGIHGVRRQQQPVDLAREGKARLDSCYAYGHQRAVVKMIWPDLYRPD